MRALRDRGLSNRTANFLRQAAIAFMNWCRQTGRVERNVLEHVRRLDEEQDRRRVRRALTDEELARLLEVAEQQGRDLWYLLAAFVGLRRSELMGLRWGDIDLDAATLTVRATVGKSRREDVVPLHPQVVERLRALRPGQLRAATLRAQPVFEREVSTRSVLTDFHRAGLARRTYVVVETGAEVTPSDARRLRKAGHRVKLSYDTRDAEGK